MRTLLLIPVTVFSLLAQQPPAPGTTPVAPAATPQGTGNDEVLKRVDDLMWHVMLDDIAHVDKVEYTSLPPARPGNPRAPGATNPLIIRAYTFIPKNLDRSKKQPLLVFCHQGIHANEDTRDAHVFRELLEQGYSIISADYRGSSGYGRGFYEQIDYGGREVEDVYLSGQWMLENYPFLDAEACGRDRLEPRRADQPDEYFRPPADVRGGVCRRPGERPGGAHGLRAGRIPGALLGAVSHRADGPRGHYGVSQALAGVPCRRNCRRPC